MNKRQIKLSCYLEQLNIEVVKVEMILNQLNRLKNNQEIANFLGKPINTITPRTNELVGLEKVELAFKAVYPATKRTVCYWRVR